MKNSVLFAAAMAALLAAGGKKKAPEHIPQPKAEEQVAASTAAPVGLLEAPGAYIKNTVGSVEKAKAAAAVYEKTAKETLGAATEVGGN